MNCSECGKAFASEVIGWRRLFCPVCVLIMENRAAAHEAKAKPYLAPQLRKHPVHAEFLANLRALIQLCHPDKHGGSELSSQVFKWLMRVKQDYPGD